MLYVNPIALGPLAPGSESGVGESTSPKRALEELEHLFLFTLLREMRRTVPKGGVLNGGREQEFFDEMLDDALSGAMAESGQLGLAAQIEAQLRLAEIQHALRPQRMHRGAMASSSGEVLPIKEMV
ncbi:MAG TPA: hypothetical protein ENN80_03975 [Candidatus Hydrogenedentes bacterium]|nr:hypothetical protein [Candidatus Hydrogenedentota bacterium]